MGTSSTRGLNLPLVLTIIFILNAFVWGSLLFIPVYAEYHTVSTLIGFFQHPPIQWVFGSLYLAAGTTMLAGAVSRKVSITRVGLFAYILVNVYRIIGGLILNGFFVAFGWLPMLTTTLIAISLWLYLGRTKT